MARFSLKVFAIICSLCCLAALFGVVLAADRGDVAYAEESYFADDAALWEDGVFTEYSVGIYWYASGNPIPRRTNPVDKTKPTIIFAHGMKPSEGYKQRDLLSIYFDTNNTFDANGYDPFELNPDYYQVLIDAGYNVGHFYWSQIADDDAMMLADKKVWSSTSMYGTTYVVNDGSGKRVQGDQSLNPNPNKSVAVIFGDAIRAALGNDYQYDLHLAGHSMGGQLVLATGEYLAVLQEKGTVGDHLVPTQVSLLDPYFGMTKISSNEEFAVDHLDGKVIPAGTPLVELACDAMETLARHDVAIDAYGTAFYRVYPTIMKKDAAAAITTRLSKYCVWTYLKSLTNEFSANPATSHCMAIDYYFSTLSEAEIAKDNYGVEVPSAKASKDYILSLRGKAFVQSLAEDKEGENPFYMHNSAYTRTDAFFEPVENDYTAYSEPVTVANIVGHLDADDAKIIELIDSDGNVVVTIIVRSNSNGNYAIYHVDNGEYTVKVYNSNSEVQLKENAIAVDTANANVSFDISEVRPEQPNLPLIIGLSVAGGVLLIGGIVAIIIIVLKKKKV